MKRRKKQKRNNSIPIIFTLILIVVMGFGAFVLFNNSEEKTVQNKTEQQEQKQGEEVKQQEIVPAYLPPLTAYKFNFKYDIKVSGSLNTLTFKMPVPIEDKYKQYVSISAISQKPHKFYKTTKGAIGEYNFANVSDDVISISFSGILKTNPYDLKTAKMVAVNFAPESDLSKYLVPEKYIESTDSFIVNIANGINGASKEEIVDKIFRYVQGTLKYTVIPNIGAKKALETKKGKCSEYAASMVALCRAKGIPARIVTGHFLRERDTSHAWVEVYYDEYGWVTYDPTILSSTIVYKDAKGKVLKVVNNLKPEEAQSNYIVLSRNELSRSPINYTFAPDSKGSAQIATQFTVEKM